MTEKRTNAWAKATPHILRVDHAGFTPVRTWRVMVGDTPIDGLHVVLCDDGGMRVIDRGEVLATAIRPVPGNQRSLAFHGARCRALALPAAAGTPASSGPQTGLEALPA